MALEGKMTSGLRFRRESKYMNVLNKNDANKEVV